MFLDTIFLLNSYRLVLYILLVSIFSYDVCWGARYGSGDHDKLLEISASDYAGALNGFARYSEI